MPTAAPMPRDRRRRTRRHRQRRSAPERARGSGRARQSAESSIRMPCRIRGRIERSSVSVLKSSVPLALTSIWFVSSAMVRSSRGDAVGAAAGGSPRSASSVDALPERKGLTTSARRSNDDAGSSFELTSVAGPTTARARPLMPLIHCRGESPCMVTSIATSVFPPRTSRLTPDAASTAPRSSALAVDAQGDRRRPAGCRVDLQRSGQPCRRMPTAWTSGASSLPSRSVNCTRTWSSRRPPARMSRSIAISPVGVRLAQRSRTEARVSSNMRPCDPAARGRRALRCLRRAPSAAADRRARATPR